MINSFVNVIRHRVRPKVAAWTMSDLRPVVLSGPSGAGKSTLIKKLFQEYPDTFAFSISHTTRRMRDGEINGKQYHFVSAETMEREIEEGKFIEYTNFSGNYYGTSIAAIKEVLGTNKVCILDIDEQGVRNIKASALDAIFVFIKPPSMEELRRRLSSRGTETEECLERRMNTAASALKFSEESGVYDFVLENDELEKAYRELRAFFKQACPMVATKPNRCDEAAELPLAANMSELELTSNMEAGDHVANNLTKETMEKSVAEIPLSPSKNSSDQDVPAKINVTETPLLVMTEFNDDNIRRNGASALLELEGEKEATSSDGVCGRQSWCVIS